MADNLTLSMTSGCEFKPKMPPGYEAGHSESEDSISPPTSPTTNPMDDDTGCGGEHDTRKKTERGDVGIVNGIFNTGEDNTIYRQLPLPVGDVVTDAEREKNSSPLKNGVAVKGVQERKGVVEKGVHERKKEVKKDVMDGGGQGNKEDIPVVENGTSSGKSQGHLNKRKEKAPTSEPRYVSEENVHEFIDEMEDVMAAMSTEKESGAADRLVAILKIFLPFVLCIVNDLCTLRVKVKDFILENRGLQKEVRHLKKEIEERDRKDTIPEMQPKICSSCGQTPSSTEPTRQGESVMPTTDKLQKQVPVEDEPMTKELRRIRSQNKELQRVNHSWEKYCKKLSVKHEIDQKKKTAQLAAADERREELEKRLEDKFKDYDQTLLHARHSEGQHRAAAEQYKKDRDALRRKYEEMTTQLREWIKEREQKDKEIQRLNQVVERQKASSQPTRLAEEGCAGHTKPSKRAVPREMAIPNPFLYVNIGEVEEETKKEKQKRASPLHPRSPRTPPADENPMTLPKDELKDQVELYRQQIDVFRTDFIQERRDREKAVGQVDTLKKELEKTKKKLEAMQTDRLEHDVYRLGQDYVPRRQRDQQRLRGGGITGYGRDYAYQNYVDPENHVYSVIQD